MKTMLLLAAASSFLFAFNPSISLAQTDPVITSASVALTCRSALQGDQFTQVLDVASPPCCYVSIEEDWYKANGVRLSSIYQRSNGDTYRAESCQLMSENGRPVDLTTTGAVDGGAGAPLVDQPTRVGGIVPAGTTSGQAPVVPKATAGDISSGNTGNKPGGNTGNKPGIDVGGNTGGSNGGQNGDDGNNGHGNDVGGFDPSNPGNSNGTGGGHGNGGGSHSSGNPGNAKDVGGAGEAPNGDVDGFKPDPGTKGKSN
jgi:hypothetical protein